MKKLVSVNIEGDRHLERIRPFIADERPDIICFQEVFRDDIEGLVGNDYHVEFLPMCLKKRVQGMYAPWGMAIASKEPAHEICREYFHQPTTALVNNEESSTDAKRRSYWQGIVGISIPDVSGNLRVFTTHFTWTPDGLSNQYQATDLERLLSFLDKQEPHLICGDFNIPRKQNALYPIMAAHYTDHIPQKYETSMYIPLHRVRDDPETARKVGEYMVDYIFSTPEAYDVRDVELRGDVSDHYAIIGAIEKVG